LEVKDVGRFFELIQLIFKHYISASANMYTQPSGYISPARLNHHSHDIDKMLCISASDTISVTINTSRYHSSPAPDRERVPHSRTASGELAAQHWMQSHKPAQGDTPVIHKVHRTGSAAAARGHHTFPTPALAVAPGFHIIHMPAPVPLAAHHTGRPAGRRIPARTQAEDTKTDRRRIFLAVLAKDSYHRWPFPFRDTTL